MIARILVRFNTKFENDPRGRTWKVLADGIESLATKVLIRVPCETITEDVAPGVTKYHFLCWGTLSWQGDVATIL